MFALMIALCIGLFMTAVLVARWYASRTRTMYTREWVVRERQLEQSAHDAVHRALAHAVLTQNTKRAVCTLLHDLIHYGRLVAGTQDPIVNERERILCGARELVRRQSGLPDELVETTRLFMNAVAAQYVTDRAAHVALRASAAQERAERTRQPRTA